MTEREKQADEAGRDLLYRQLDGLGQMIADGLADEPDGKWIRKQYRDTCIALGIAKPSDFRKPRTNHTKQINVFMTQRVKEELCQKCSSILKQSRSGSLIAICTRCGARYRLGHLNRRKRGSVKE